MPARTSESPEIHHELQIDFGPASEVRSESQGFFPTMALALENSERNPMIHRHCFQGCKVAFKRQLRNAESDTHRPMRFLINHNLEPLLNHIETCLTLVIIDIEARYISARHRRRIMSDVHGRHIWFQISPSSLYSSFLSKYRAKRNH